MNSGCLSLYIELVLAKKYIREQLMLRIGNVNAFRIDRETFQTIFFFIDIVSLFLTFREITLNNTFLFLELVVPLLKTFPKKCNVLTNDV